ncbi:AraC family transcriptional regulator [Capsulimonas corticalis]|uniref:methylated-DNA--[protein]-cysteine S-methyltransferase n=1 Tax=Capsulimonas corticalis TaxID=2219043 RepID=A0A402D1R1_9BACT|nr:bifunctional DNA-binding transcriptional regulator/O6-methylguanine-DNA methyltransferase Ada [Capsulimonas corticalis]BDI28694.1 AraC family transcriptional regulator [Capsulimonas corticalis]
MTTMTQECEATTASPMLLSDDERWDAIARRDAAADGAFYYSVRTTGVYCRPSCASRPANRVNIQFHATCADAELAGFRACKRCRPDGDSLARRRAAAVAEACRLIEASDEAPALDALAESAGVSRFHFHRIFKAVTGVTPKAYADAHRARRVRDQIAHGANISEAIYEAGYQSNSRFYEASNGLLGMTPTAFRAGGAGAVIRFAIGESSLGPILVAATDKGVCAILMGDDPEALARDLQDRFPKAQLIGGDQEFETTVAQVVRLIETPARGLDLPLDIRGTAFQQQVWQALREIAPGSTASYADIAARIGKPKAVRAVAQACASNAIAVAIPCHRIVRTDGELSGYRWGVERKRALLDREAGA